jgi:serine/threonine protein kinase
VGVAVTCPDDATLVELVAGQLDSTSINGLDQHLDSCDECRQVVASLSADGGELHRGASLGRYLIVDVVGSGAMGLVYEAYDPTLHRRVALKVLRAEAPDARLLREARALARLTHPNVVTVYEVGESERGVFVAMELVEGDALSVWTAARTRTIGELCEVFAQAAAGLGAAHGAGLVHRDVKPDNLIVGRDGRVRVTDFGLARAGETSDCDASPPSERLIERTISRTGALLGTPAYMAPEQLRGEPASPASDQFGLCVALFEAVYGERPFAGSDLASLRAAVLEGEPRAVARVGVPRWLEAIVLRGLARDPSRRYPAITDLEAELRRDRRGRRRWLWGAAATAVVATSVGHMELTRTQVHKYDFSNRYG